MEGKTGLLSRPRLFGHAAWCVIQVTVNTIFMTYLTQNVNLLSTTFTQGTLFIDAG